jgi:hypothetical protein
MFEKHLEKFLAFVSDFNFCFLFTEKKKFLFVYFFLFYASVQQLDRSKAMDRCEGTLCQRVAPERFRTLILKKKLLKITKLEYDCQSYSVNSKCFV